MNGVVTGGWNFVVAAYLVTFSVLFIYGVSIVSRLREESKTSMTPLWKSAARELLEWAVANIPIATATGRTAKSRIGRRRRAAVTVAS